MQRIESVVQQLWARLHAGQKVDVPLAPVAGDDLDDDDRWRLHAALDASEDDVQSGRVRDAADVLADLRRA